MNPDHGPWIHVVPFEEASEELREAAMAARKLYPPEYGLPVESLTYADGTQAGSIVMSHSLIPKALFHGFATLGVLLSDELPLSRAQHEMIAATVSALNKCHY